MCPIWPFLCLLECWLQCLRVRRGSGHCMFQDIDHFPILGCLCMCSCVYRIFFACLGYPYTTWHLWVRRTITCLSSTTLECLNVCRGLADTLSMPSRLFLWFFKIWT